MDRYPIPGGLRQECNRFAWRWPPQTPDDAAWLFPTLHLWCTLMAPDDNGTTTTRTELIIFSFPLPESGRHTDGSMFLLILVNIPFKSDGKHLADLLTLVQTHHL